MQNDFINEIELKIELKIDSFWIFDTIGYDGGWWASRWRRFKSERLTAFCSTWAMKEFDKVAVPPSGLGWKPKNFKNSKFLLIILYFIKKKKIKILPKFMNWEKLNRKVKENIKKRHRIGLHQWRKGYPMVIRKTTYEYYAIYRSDLELHVQNT